MTVTAKMACATVLWISAHGINLPSLHYSMYVVTRSAGCRLWGACGPGVVGGPMCGYRIFRYGM